MATLPESGYVALVEALTLPVPHSPLSLKEGK